MSRILPLLPLLLLFAAPPVQCQWPGQGASAPGLSSAQKSRPDVRRFGTVVKGNSSTGGDGCYLGECPNKEPAPEPSDPDGGVVPPPGREPRTPQPRPQPQSLVTNICQTPAFWCAMNQSGAVGMSCYCNLPYPMGFANGITVPAR